MKMALLEKKKSKQPQISLSTRNGPLRLFLLDLVNVVCKDHILVVVVMLKGKEEEIF